VWQERAACNSTGLPHLTARERVALFFPADGDYRAARDVCAGCGVRGECAAAGVNQHGLWGGLSENERHPPPGVSVSVGSVVVWVTGQQTLF
jgi:hypothetical protein